MQALDADPARSPASSRRRSAATRAGSCARYRTDDAETVVVALGSVLGTIEDVVDELRERGRAASARSAISCFRPLPLDEVRAALGARASASSCSRRPSRSASAGSSRPTCGWRSHGLARRACTTVDRRARRPRDHRRARCARCSTTRSPTGSPRADLPRPRPRARRARARRARERRDAPGPHAENMLRDLGTVAAGPVDDAWPTSRSSSTRPARFAVGNRLLDAGRSARCRRTRSARTRSPPGHRACQGCGEALGARYALDAAMRATDGRLIAVNATGCLEVFSTPYPETLVAAAVDALAVRQRAGGRDRHRRGAAGQGPRPTSASSARAATAAPSTSASAACRGCSSATTTCSTSATTTRPT